VLSFREALHKIVVVLTVAEVVAVTTGVVVAPVPLSGVKVEAAVLLMRTSPDQEIKSSLIILKEAHITGATKLPLTPAST
jgi:hypothetical protein